MSAARFWRAALTGPRHAFAATSGAQVAELAGLHDEVHRFPHQQAE